MVFIAPFIGAVAILSGFASALPRPADSSIGEEVGVSAPDGIPITNTAELKSQSAAEAAATMGSNKAMNYGAAAATTTSMMHEQTTTSMMHDSSSSSVMMHDSSSSSSVMMHETTTSSAMMHDTTSSSAWVESSKVWESTSTSSAWESKSTSYGSGSSNWGGSGYDDCVQKCIATFGAPPAQYTPPTSTSGSEGSVGTGATHTVIVAPTQGVLRYIPFALNASVGDTIQFMWGANNHTVTKGSQLLPCNKSGDALFTSGEHDKDFVFTQVVNTTDPTFYFCNTPGHCQKGMFGIINPPSSFNAPTSVSGMMQSMTANSSDLNAYASYTDKMTTGSPSANWGGNIDLVSLPDWSQSLVAENVLFTRNLLATNPDIVRADGSVDLGATSSTPLMIPQDISAALNSAASSPSSADAATSPSTSAAESSASVSATSAPASNGAGSMASPRVLVGIMAAAAAFLLL